ncbi:MAG TPA: DinB family protein [Dongiaceae bacterium]|jgi:uncharacterized damage-inducible protein DinB
MTPVYVRMMAAYGVWMNGRVLDLCGRLADAERRRDLGAFFKSIHGTFDHLIYGDVSWMGRFTDGPMPAKRIGEVAYETWQELAAARRALDQRMEAWAGDVTERWLGETMSYVSVNDGKTRILPRWVLVTHMFNHGTHHRGQLTTLMKQVGIDPGVTDLPWLPALYDGTVLAGRQM